MIEFRCSEVCALPPNKGMEPQGKVGGAASGGAVGAAGTAVGEGTAVLQAKTRIDDT